jgi:hypothetical protein
MGWSVTSEGRGAHHNAEVGGQPNSRHLIGQALDVWHDNPQQRKALMQTVNAMPGLLALDEGNHIHIQTTGAR